MVKVVRVLWVDSCMKYEQLSPHELPSVIVIESAGILMAETDEHITLARDLHADGDCRGVIAIPKVAVRKMTILPPIVNWDPIEGEKT